MSHTRLVLHNLQDVNHIKMDIVLEDGKISQITHAGNGKGEEIIDCSDVYVSSGWIDMHVHAFPKFKPYGDYVDEIGIKQGVTTVVDAGSCGADHIEELFSNNENKTNLFAFLNISHIGLERTDELSELSWIDEDKVIESYAKYSDSIVGLKARISKSVVGTNGVKPLHLARQLSDKTSLPLMVHIGSAPPDIKEVLPCLKKHDIITHYLNGKANNLFDREGKPLQELITAINSGVHLDVGHGTASFSFKIAELAKQHQITFNTISTDIYKDNRINGPVYNMAYTLTKFLYLGYTLKEIIAAVTINASNWLNRPELGRIQVGDLANLTLFKIKPEKVQLTDSTGETRIADKIIEPIGVVINGEVIIY